MTPIDVGNLFDDALNTFKAFDNLTPENSGQGQEQFPTSVWQILNHLLKWQAGQLHALRGNTAEHPFSEATTWLSQRAPSSEAVLQEAVAQFHGQLAAFQTELHYMAATEEADRKLKILQEVVLHLAFHVGEVVLIRRVQGSYPLPDQMQDFLAS
ncbi:hypothetical protein MTX78_14310 [Hymenobacter tibetensis]|uniref:DinB-like domain-containing protein n=1 Tax=Hymenobacter tibetensis TaxID=497967 RepID=A0ABY4CSQ9_9BACT|nr:DinB family protein [Hymenobacter tibetensis]UOG73296.1 hypothetical protein MTX78_14310 [Hymenobacter tibetensis]